MCTVFNQWWTTGFFLICRRLCSLLACTIILSALVGHSLLTFLLARFEFRFQVAPVFHTSRLSSSASFAPDWMWRLLGTFMTPMMASPAILLTTQENSGLPPSFLSTWGSHLGTSPLWANTDLAEPANMQGRPQTPLLCQFHPPLAPPLFRLQPAFSFASIVEIYLVP